ncbi:MAG: OB-fold nucleic acid binding domain-containing protein [Propionibacteriales bacterium]|nr:OB-fold nucleic acid binding domain-containing protein [Propionibacteriales bacterium]
MSTQVDGGWVRRTLKRFSATPDELEADELEVERESQGCQQIKGLHDRELVTVYGHVKHVSLAPRAGTPTLEASLYDGSGLVTLVWLGRRKILGIKPGVGLVAHGRVSCHDGRRVIFNPRYELQV